MTGRPYRDRTEAGRYLAKKLADYAGRPEVLVLALSRGGVPVAYIDDGLATGASMRAAVAALRQEHPARIVVAVPIAASSTCAEFREEVDEIVCARTPEPFRAVGLWYDDFTQTTDEEVRYLLGRAREGRDAAGQPAQTRAR
jgi:predicted phosphoribosyltransferase